MTTRRPDQPWGGVRGHWENKLTEGKGRQAERVDVLAGGAGRVWSTGRKQSQQNKEKSFST